MGRSAHRLEDILNAVARTAARLCEARDAQIALVEGDHLRAVAHHGRIPGGRAIGEVYSLDRHTPIGRALLERRVVHVRDMARAVRRSFPSMATVHRQSGSRTVLVAPLLRGETPVGGIVIRRTRVQPFTAKQIALLKTFADQAAIAIENARLSEELQERNQALTEALERETATSEILGLISASPTDLEPVFNAIMASATRLCDAQFANLYLYDGAAFDLVAAHGTPPEWEALLRQGPIHIDRPFFRPHGPWRVVHVEDLLTTEPYRKGVAPWPQAATLGGVRTFVGVPMVKSDRLIGSMMIYRREVRPFTSQQITLLQTFADQAAIAIENVRLFKELQARNSDLTEALEQQTATSEILRVISSSPTDPEPVFNTILANACRLCDANLAAIWRYDGEMLVGAAHCNASPEFADFLMRTPIRPGPQGPARKAALERRLVHVADMTNEPGFSPVILQVERARTVLAVPLLRENALIGVVAMWRREVRPFTEQQVALVQTLADQAVIAIENVRLFTELQARNRDLTVALDQQTATSEILKVISSSPTDVQPVFDTIVSSAARLCSARFAVLVRLIDDHIHRAASNDVTAEWLEVAGRVYPQRLTANAISGLAMLERRPIHVPDVAADTRFPGAQDLARAMGYRIVVFVPMLRDDAPIGAIGLAGDAPFTEQQIELLQTFADQAVIAIENVRLFNELQARNHELTEALDQQTATSEILSVISSSPTDVQPVFDAIAASAVRLCGAVFGCVYRFDGELLHFVAQHQFSPEALELIERQYPLPPRGLNAPVIFDRIIVHSADVLTDPRATNRELARTLGYRSFLGVPMLRDGHPIGSITVFGPEARPFSSKQIALLQTFAAQAVIAVENVRLFTELQARNRELTDALEQQTATSEILRVISSSPTDVQPTFKAIATSASRLCEADDGSVFRFDGSLIHLVGQYRPESHLASIVHQVFPMRPGRGSVTARAILTRAVAHVSDIATDPEYDIRLLVSAGFRSVLSVPMLREGEPVGAITVSRRGVQPFSDTQLALLQTFADQAVIAIENVRLFTELEARNRALMESLDRQTATADVLRIIAQSPAELQPVLDAIAASAVRLCEASDAVIERLEGNRFYNAAHAGAQMKGLMGLSLPLTRRFPGGRAILDRMPVILDDIHLVAEREYPDTLELLKLNTIHSVAEIPLLSEGKPLGSLAVLRAEVRPFTDAEIALLQTFADQAVIAIENVRLFTELQQRNRALTEALEQQTATAEILRVISSSPTDLQPVADAVAENAARLCGADDVVIWRIEGDRLTATAHVGSVRMIGPSLPISRGLVIGCAVLDGRTMHVHDMVEENRRGNYPESAENQRRVGYRTLLVTPLMREGKAIGAIGMRRLEVRPFTDKQIALLQTFADQAVIAIENVRLFNELQARTRDLTRSVEQLRALSDVSQAVSSSLDLETVLSTIVARANQLAGTEACTVYEYDEAAEEFRLRATHNLDEETVAIARATPVRKGEGAAGRIAVTHAPVEIPDILAEGAYHGPLREALVRTGARALLAIPLAVLERGRPASLLGEEQLIGALTVTRKTVGKFPAETIELLKTFATQSALAIHNARLFREIEDKGRQLEVASRHKSQFLANMSHELRTPLNAILGYTELIADNIYGQVPEKMGEVLERVDKSGRHLLGLINDILDLSKIEAGQLTLGLVDYSMDDVVRTVAASVESLAADKKLELAVSVEPDLPLGHGDARRLTQVLLNLVGNALKFTDAGRVTVDAGRRGEAFLVSVADTGPGIAPGDLERIFEEFQQANTANTRAKGGTGLGLAIARRIIEMHGGRLWVESTVGQGSTFSFSLPIHAEAQ